MNVPNDLKYTDSHEWVRAREPTARVTIGITDHAQAALGDLVFVELPQGRPQRRGAAKRARSSSRSRPRATSTRRSPATIVAGNDELAGAPEAVNEDAVRARGCSGIKPADAARRRQASRRGGVLEADRRSLSDRDPAWTTS